MDAGSPASTAPIRCLNRQTPLMASSNFTKLAITAAWAAATFCSGGMAQPTAPGSAQPGNYRQLRPELFKALAACHQTAEVLACETASSALQTMLVVSQLPLQRQLAHHKHGLQRRTGCLACQHLSGLVAGGQGFEQLRPELSVVPGLRAAGGRGLGHTPAAEGRSCPRCSDGELGEVAARHQRCLSVQAAYGCSGRRRASVHGSASAHHRPRIG